MFATRSTRHTKLEKPSASRVRRILRYCGMYGTMPPNTIAPTLPHVISWRASSTSETGLRSSPFASASSMTTDHGSRVLGLNIFTTYRIQNGRGENYNHFYVMDERDENEMTRAHAATPTPWLYVPTYWRNSL